MSKTKRHEKIAINHDDIKIRRDWGDVRPYTRIEENKKTNKQRKECRKFKRLWRDGYNE